MSKKLLNTVSRIGMVAALCACIAVEPKNAAAQGADPLADFGSSFSTEQSAEAPMPTFGGPQDAGLGFDSPNNMSIQLSQEEQQQRLQEKTRSAAFDAAINSIMPLRPDEIERTLEKFRETRHAAEARVGGMPTPEIVVKTVSLDPGSVPEKIKMSPDHVTVLNIVDITGQPWPIEDFAWGGDFAIQTTNRAGTHMLHITPNKANEVGNLMVKLAKFDTPLSFTLTTDLESVQYRFDARVPDYGPFATPPIIDPGITTVAGDTQVTSVLEGLVPANAEKLTVIGPDGRTTAYRVGGATYVRTPLSLLSPGWSKSARSADGTTVYVINNSPILLLSDKGKMVRATLEEGNIAQ